MFSKIAIITVLLLSLCSIDLEIATATDQSQPNIVLIYTDDFGFGDISANGATAVSTPNIDSIAKEGIRFTDAHAPSATCTPSRYAMLTGEYAWRRKGTGIARGDAAAIIKPGRVTMPSLLKQAGYNTAVVGKWHLGLGDGNVDWNKAIKPGPLEIGFDYCYLIPATGDRVPCVYVENHHVVDLDPADPITVSFKKKIGDAPTGKDIPETLKQKWAHGHNATIVNGISRIGFMTGGEKARWVDEDMADRITEKAVAYIDKQKDETAPFFLFFSTHDIHVPRVPHKRFVGKTDMGPRGDTIVETDWCVGELLKALKRNGKDDNTIVIFTSDNGPVINDGYHDQSVERLGDHKPAGPWRGGKYSNFEGGTRVPLLIKWPGKIKAGTVSDALVGQIDFAASFAAISGNESKITITEKAIPDSIDALAALTGKSDKGRTLLVEHARSLALRQGPWKYVQPSKAPSFNKNTKTELGTNKRGQLYNLAIDGGEKKNLRDEHPEKFAELREKLSSIRAAGRTRPVLQNQ